MNSINHMTDPAVLDELGERLAQHRLDRNLTQAQLAEEAGVSKRTLVRLEGGESTQLTNLIRVVRALGLLSNLDTFIPPPLQSPIEQLQREGKKRKRATPRTDSTEPESNWVWGDESQDGDQS